MKLREQFAKNDYYHSILDKENTRNNDELFIEYLYDVETESREELYDIFLSKYRDELFIILKMDNLRPIEICDWWDTRISRFMAFGSYNRDILNGVKYNVIQILLYKGVERKFGEKTIIALPDELDRSEEGSLNISRKIFLPYMEDENDDFEIPDDEAVEIPFYLIPMGDFMPDEKLTQKLNDCIPKPGEVDILFSEIKKNNKNVMSYNDEPFQNIKEWLLNDNTKNRDQ